MSEALSKRSNVEKEIVNQISDDFLRPKQLSAMWGQEKLATELRNQMAQWPPSTLMFVGGTGTGKTTIGRIAARAFNCDHQLKWGDVCAPCWQQSYAIHEINASSERGVEEIGKLVELANIAPLHGHKRVIMLDEIQGLSQSAQKLLLKPTEEPPPTTVWIICTTDPQKLLPTLRRRPTTYVLQPLGYEQREKYIRGMAHTLSITRDLLPLIEQAQEQGIGSPAILLKAVRKYGAGARPEEAVCNTDVASANTLAICKSVTNGEWKQLRDLLADAQPEEARWIRASVCGWLRGIMSKNSDHKTVMTAAASLHELTAQAPFEDNQLLFWLWPVLWKICARYAALNRG